MGENRTVAAEAFEYASLRRRAATRTGPPGHGRNLVRIADGLPVECTECHWHLFQQHRPSTVPAMDRSRRLPESMVHGFAGVRRVAGDRLVLAVDGRRDDQGSTGWGEKPARTPQIWPKKVSK